MALTIKQLNEFAKNTSFTQKAIKEIYDYLVKEHTAQSVNIEHVAFVVRNMNENGFTNLTEWINWNIEKNKPKPLTKEEVQENLRQELNKRTAENERIKRGYSRADWKKIITCETEMKGVLGKLLPEFMSELVVKEVKPEDEASVKIFEKYEIFWKNFCRRNIINKYPGSKEGHKASELRGNILNLFAVKVNEMIGRVNQEKQGVQ